MLKLRRLSYAFGLLVFAFFTGFFDSGAMPVSKLLGACWDSSCDLTQGLPLCPSQYAFCTMVAETLTPTTPTPAVTPTAVPATPGPGTPTPVPTPSDTPPPTPVPTPTYDTVGCTACQSDFDTATTQAGTDRDTCLGEAAAGTLICIATALPPIDIPGCLAGGAIAAGFCEANYLYTTDDARQAMVSCRIGRHC
jgi:hypothetical protein